MKSRNHLQKKWNIMKSAVPLGIVACIKCFIALWALSGDSLSLMLSGYSMDVPVAKYVFTLFGALDGWGIEMVFTALGLSTVFYLVRDRQKSPWVTGISLFFAVCTVFGISYMKTNSWDCIFLFNLQFALATFVMLGYYFAYKNSILFIGYLFERKKNWLRREPNKKIEYFLFQEHSFSGPLLFVLVFALPWLIFYFPGTLQWDAHAQLLMYLGVVEKTGHHPVVVTELMGGCILLGRQLFYSDTIGLFFFTITQFMLQSLTLAYASYVMGRLNPPILFRWGALLFWAVYPYFPIWGYTMVKDTLYYVFILLLVAVLQDIIYDSEKSIKWWKKALFMSSIIGITLFRNEGCYVVLITLICAALLYREYWKICLAGISVCLLLVFVVENIYMPYNNIPAGPKGEMLSIPLQQTGRYLKEHYSEVTGEEAAILQEGFTIPLEQVANMYNPVCSDGVKTNFQKHPDTTYMKSYFNVWFQQLKKHPDTYIQAFLNHTYGYFYPNVHNYGDYMGFFYIGNSDQWHDGYLDIEFGIADNKVRRILEHTLYLAEESPVFGMLLSAGMHTYILLGEFIYLMAKKKRREILILIPGFCVLLVCLVSPVNAFLRYIMPIMATLPVTVTWCYVVTHTNNTIEKKNATDKKL